MINREEPKAIMIRQKKRTINLSHVCSLLYLKCDSKNWIWFFFFDKHEHSNLRLWCNRSKSFFFLFFSLQCPHRTFDRMSNRRWFVYKGKYFSCIHKTLTKTPKALSEKLLKKKKNKTKSCDKIKNGTYICYVSFQHNVIIIMENISQKLTDWTLLCDTFRLREFSSIELHE